MAKATEPKKAPPTMAEAMASKHGKDSVTILNSKDVVALPFGVVPTGSLALDEALGTHGWPRGRVIEIFKTLRRLLNLLDKVLILRSPTTKLLAQHPRRTGGGALQPTISQVLAFRIAAGQDAGA